MKKHIILFAIFCSAASLAHADVTAVNKENFNAAMTHYFERKGTLCLKFKPWPIVLHEGNQPYEKNEMTALEAIGLVKGEDVEVDAGATEVVGKSKRYSLTRMGQFVKETSWPLDIPEGELKQKTAKAFQATALEDTGLIQGSDTKVTIGSTEIKARRYTLTEAASIVQKTDWPQDLTESELSQKTSRANEMAGLETAGLLKGEDIAVTRPVKTKARSYSLTSAANPFVQDGNLCWGKRQLDKIEKWETNDAYWAGVTYTYKIADVADWAKKPEVQDAFYEIKSVLENKSAQALHNLKLTSKGWEAEGLDD